MSSTSHEFALYLDQNPVIAPVITDLAIITRITRVLRLRSGNQIIIFNNSGWWRVTLGSVTSSKITVQAQEQGAHIRPTPEIIHLLPMLKREALEAACYNLTVLGVSQIYLLQTERTHQIHKNSTQLLSRLRAITIAAAEQSKQYMLPVIYEPRPLTGDLLQELGTTLIPIVLFDPAGARPESILEKLKTCAKKQLITVAGPEAGFTSEEHALFDSAQAHRCALTPAILRAEDAVLLGVGIMRMGI